MKVNLKLYNEINNYPSSQKSEGNQFSPAFGGIKARKLIEKIKAAKKLTDISVTFKDMAAVYEELGYDIILKGGSHAVIPITDKVNLPLVIPHNSKYVHRLDLKRLKFILNGEIDRALNVH